MYNIHYNFCKLILIYNNQLTFINKYFSKYAKQYLSR